MVGDLVRDGKGGGLGVLGSEVCESSVELSGELDFVDVVLREGLVDADGKTGPDDIVGVDGRNEECGFRGLYVVDESAVGEVAPGEVVEVSALTG